MTIPNTEIVVINLDRNTDRWARLHYKFNALTLPITRFSAVDGQLISKKNPYVHPVCGYLCSPGIKGCGMSHIKIWEQFLTQSSQPFLCVCEDDITPLPVLKQILNKLDTIHNTLTFDYLSLSCNGPFCGGWNVRNVRNVRNAGEFEFAQPIWPLSTACYVVSREGVIKLLQHSNRVYYHIDSQIANSIYADSLNIWSLKSPKAVILSYVNSTLTSNNYGIIPNLLSNYPVVKWSLNCVAFQIGYGVWTVYHSVLFILLLLLLLFTRSRVLPGVLLIELILASIPKSNIPI